MACCTDVFVFAWNQFCKRDLDHVFGGEGVQVSPVLNILPPLVVDNWTDCSVGRGELRDYGGGVPLFLLLNHHWQLGINNFYM